MWTEERLTTEIETLESLLRKATDSGDGEVEVLRQLIAHRKAILRQLQSDKPHIQ